MEIRGDGYAVTLWMGVCGCGGGAGRRGVKGGFKALSASHLSIRLSLADDLGSHARSGHARADISKLANFKPCLFFFK